MWNAVKISKGVGGVEEMMMGEGSLEEEVEEERESKDEREEREDD